MHDGQRRLSLPLKITTVGAVFLLPIVVLCYFVVARVNGDIEFSAFEVDGDAYQRPVEQLLDGVQQHQLLLHGCPPGTDCPAALARVAGDVATAFGALAAVNDRLGTELQFTPDGLAKRGRDGLTVPKVRARWEDVLARAGKVKPGSTVPQDLDDAYDAVVADLRGVITHAGDTSNLILDPDLDSYYLMDVTLLALPQTQDRLAHVIAHGRDVLRSGSPSHDARVQLAVDAAMLDEADFARVKGSSDTAMNEDANFYGVQPGFTAHIKKAREGYEAATARFIAMTRDLAAGNPRFDADAYVAAGTAARAESFALWRTAVDELDGLLANRIAHHTSWRTKALAGSGAAALVACLLSLLVMRSITKPLARLARSLGPGADLLSNSVERIAEASQKASATPEEAAIICEELNAHADDMRKAVAELVSLVEGGVAGTPVRVAAEHGSAQTPARRVA